MGFFEQIMSLEPHYQWLIIALIMGIAEIIVPGVFLIWLAAAAAITGFVAMFIDITVAGQFTLFGVLALASVFFGRRWYLSNKVESSDPLLNDRRARLVGTNVVAVTPINATSGRVKVGDSEWPARGPALNKGETARVVDVASGVLVLEEIAD